MESQKIIPVQLGTSNFFHSSWISCIIVSTVSFTFLLQWKRVELIYHLRLLKRSIRRSWAIFVVQFVAQRQFVVHVVVLVCWPCYCFPCSWCLRPNFVLVLIVVFGSIGGPGTSPWHTPWWSHIVVVVLVVVGGGVIVVDVVVVVVVVVVVAV